MWSTVLALSVREKNGTKNPDSLNSCCLLGLIWFKIIKIESYNFLQFLFFTWIQVWIFEKYERMWAIMLIKRLFDHSNKRLQKLVLGIYWQEKCFTAYNFLNNQVQTVDCVLRHYWPAWPGMRPDSGYYSENRKVSHNSTLAVFYIS